MNAQIVTIESLFQEQISYRIPQFQRPYAWEEKVQWGPLWEDVRSVADRFLKKDRRPHFMGAIVLQLQESNTGEVAKRLVIDGQQRLTTLQLLIKATEQVFQSQDDTVRATRLSKLTTNLESHWSGDNSNETKIRQSNSDDRGAFRAAITNHHSTNRFESLAISKSHEYFEEAVKDWMNIKPEDRKARADALEEALTKDLQIAVIDLDPDEKPHLIFATLNGRAAILTQSDLIKNTVMYEADVTDDPDKAKELWGMFEDRWWREEVDKTPHIERFLYFWMIMRTKRAVPVDRFATNFQDYVETKNREIGERSIWIVAEDIRRAAGIYKEIEEARISEIQTSLERLKVMKLGVVTPLLLWLYTSEVSPEQRRRSAEALESCLVRQMLCGYSSNNLNNIVIAILNFLEDPSRMESFLKLFPHHEMTNHDFANPSDIIVTGFDLHKQWASDQELFDCLTSQPMRGAVPRRKMVLEAVEMYLRGDKAEPILDTAKLTVEHVMPQKWQKNWTPPPGEDEIDASNERDRVIKFIGNLTLVTGRLNSNLKDNPWDQKRKTLDNHSGLFLNKQMLSDAPDVWDEASIKIRSSDLAKIIMQIWLSAETFNARWHS